MESSEEGGRRPEEAGLREQEAGALEGHEPRNVLEEEEGKEVDCPLTAYRRNEPLLP